MIRNFNEEDIDQIYALGDSLTSNFSKTNNLLQIQNDIYTKILVYVGNQEIKGFLMFTELEETSDIIDIVVKEEYRNQKIGSCLIDYMISGLKESIKLITLEVRKSNFLAIHLYEKFGFEIVTTRKKYYEDEDAYLMGRRVK